MAVAVPIAQATAVPVEQPSAPPDGVYPDLSKREPGDEESGPSAARRAWAGWRQGALEG
eukprot:CAMPEP_0174926458 /NCGR_PEP_ID=MMETSP1355-20121228/11263_1 /TAXON_ID=464990 /ORGANISM="Hemiselmis tepida, Strain CCMP443" /LENGTH=58 /DNA_ID=CAMNT_0016172493 /DNA_START=17 /DNA_END=194 /DNA_ORIENTATION=+